MLYNLYNLLIVVTHACVQAQEELKAALLPLEGERDSLQERLVAAKETNCALEQELQAREAR